MGGLAKQVWVCVFGGRDELNIYSVGGKKGKETPVAINEVALAITMPSKTSTTMKKRGDEDLDSKYLSKSLTLALWSET